MAREPRLWRSLVGGVLAALWLGQVVLMVRQGNWGWVPLAHAWQRPLAWRSARFYRSPSFAAEVEALRAIVPPEERVVLPPQTTNPDLGRAREMEWFLFPRRVTNCVEVACLQKWATEGRAFVVGPATALSAVVPRTRWVPVNDEVGVVLPQGAASLAPHPEAPVGPWRWLLEFLAEGALLALMAWGGWGVFVLLRGKRLSGVPLWITAWALGSGALTLGVFGLLLAGATLRGAFWGTAFLLGGLGLWAWKKGPRIRLGLPREAGGWFPWIGYGILVGWAGLLSLLAVGKGYHATDALGIWAIKGYGIAHWGLRQGTYLGFVRDYPLHIPLLIALPKALWGDLTGMSKLVFPVFFLGILSVLYWATYRASRSVGWAFLTAAFWATAPLVVHHAEIAYANLALAFYLFLGLWLWLEEEEARSAGLVLAWAVWTRPEGWLLVGAALLLGGLWTAPRQRLGKVTAPPLGMFVVWLLTRRLAYAYRFAPGVLKTFWPGVVAFLHGEMRPDALAAVAGAWLRFFGVHRWGVLGGLALLGGGLLLVLGLWSGRRDGGSFRPFGAMAALGLGLIVTVSGIYYFTAYLSEHDIQWWIRTGFDRLSLPAVTLLWYAVCRGWRDLAQGARRRRAISQSLWWR